MGTQDYTRLIIQVDQFIRKYYKNQIIKGSLYGIGLVVVFYLAIVVLEFFAQFDVFFRTFLFYGLLSSVGIILIRFIGIPLAKLYKYGNFITHQQAAVIIGEHFPEVKDKLLNTLQLEDQLTPENQSELGLVKASIEQKSSNLKSVLFSSAIDFNSNRPYIKYAAIPISIVFFILFAAPSVIKTGTKRIVNHDVQFVKGSPIQFVVDNPSLSTMQNEDFKLLVSVKGDVKPNSVYVEWGNKKARLVRDKQDTFVHLFKSLQSNITFNLNSGEFSSEKFEITVIPKPTIVDFETHLKYPRYLNKENELFRNIGDLVVPEGTSVTWGFTTANAESVKVRLRNNHASKVMELQTIAGQEATCSASITQSSDYSIVANSKEMNNKDSLVYMINVIPDKYPTIVVDEHKDTSNVKRLFFTGMVKDDYGITRLTFNIKALTQSLTSDRGVGVIDLSIGKGLNDLQFFHSWDVGELELQPGDELAYYFEVWDNDGVNGAKSTKSKIRQFVIPGLKELTEIGEKRNEKIKDVIQDNILLAKKIKEDLEKVRRKLMERKDLGWEEKRSIQQMLRNQKNLQNNIEGINQKIEEQLKQQTAFREIDDAIVKKQQQLQKLFDEIMSEEMKDLFKQMNEMMEKSDKKKLEEMLKDMDMNAKDVEKELDRSLEIFKQLAFEQKIADAIENLEKLEEEQSKLQDDTKNGTDPTDSLAKQQENLNSEFEDIAKDIDEAEKMNKELEYPNEFNGADKEEKEVSEMMKESSEQLDKGNKKKASGAQEGAAQAMQKMVDKLKKMQEDMHQEGAAEDMHALRQLLENIIKLSFDQEDLMIEYKASNVNSPHYVKLSKDQKKLQDDAKMIEDSLFALSKRVVEIEPFINREINKINDNIGRVLSHMQDRKVSNALSRQQYVMTSVNNLALLLDEVLEQMQQNMSQKPNQSCQKPGCKKSKCQKPGQGKPSISSMRKMQEKLRQSIQQMKDGQGKPGKSGKSGMNKMLVKMAAEQEALRNELNRINQELNKDGNGSLGNLEQLEKLMEQTEQDLVNKQITRETMQRQQEIVTRLLRAENAERERELDDKREATEGKNGKFSNPVEFLEYKKVKMKELELLKTVPASLKPFYKLKVDEYFNNFKAGTP